LAVVGVRSLLTKEVERIRSSEWRQVARLDVEIHRLAQKLARGELDKAETYPEVDYEPALHAFSEPPEPKQIEAMLQDIPVRVAVPFLTAAARAYNYLRGQFPIAVEHTVFGAVQLEPGDFALGMFEDLLEIVDRPLMVFQMAETGRLTTKQAMAMQTVYPTLYKEIVVEIIMACMAEKGDHPESWQPDFDRGMSVLLGIPGLDANLRTLLAAPPPKPEEPEPRRMPAKSQRAHLIATQSDRLELDE
jgi:hypothetical protein